MNQIKFTLTDDQINEIAQDINCGFLVFIHKQTAEILSMPDFLDDSFAEEEYWERMQQEAPDFDDYYEIEKPGSHDSFMFMADFADKLADSKFKEELSKALDKRKPFREFMSIIDHSDYRKEWFQFKNQRLKDWVTEQLKP